MHPMENAEKPCLAHPFLYLGDVMVLRASSCRGVARPWAVATQSIRCALDSLLMYRNNTTPMRPRPHSNSSSFSLARAPPQSNSIHPKSAHLSICISTADQFTCAARPYHAMSTRTGAVHSATRPLTQQDFASIDSVRTFLIARRAAQARFSNEGLVSLPSSDNNIHMHRPET